jgi:hypothetical protein
MLSFLVLFTGGLIVTALHFARHPVPRAVPVPA